MKKHLKKFIPKASIFYSDADLCTVPFTEISNKPGSQAIMDDRQWRLSKALPTGFEDFLALTSDYCEYRQANLEKYASLEEADTEPFCSLYGETNTQLTLKKLVAIFTNNIQTPGHKTLCKDIKTLLIDAEASNEKNVMYNSLCFAGHYLNEVLLQYLAVRDNVEFVVNDKVFDLQLPESPDYSGLCYCPDCIVTIKTANGYYSDVVRVTHDNYGCSTIVKLQTISRVYRGEGIFIDKDHYRFTEREPCIYVLPVEAYVAEDYNQMTLGISIKGAIKNKLLCIAYALAVYFKKQHVVSVAKKEYGTSTRATDSTNSVKNRKQIHIPGLLTYHLKSKGAYKAAHIKRAKHSTHASPVEHIRRSHERHYKSGKTIVVRETVVNKGKSSKAQYRLPVPKTSMFESDATQLKIQEI